jgi:hypothetical protein
MSIPANAASDEINCKNIKHTFFIAYDALGRQHTYKHRCGDGPEPTTLVCNL